MIAQPLLRQIAAVSDRRLCSDELDRKSAARLSIDVANDDVALGIAVVHTSPWPIKCGLTDILADHPEAAIAVNTINGVVVGATDAEDVSADDVDVVASDVGKPRVVHVRGLSSGGLCLIRRPTEFVADSSRKRTATTVDSDVLEDEVPQAAQHENGG